MELNITDGVMAASVVVGSIFFAGDELLGMKELPVRSLSNFVDDGRFEVNKNGARHVFSYKKKKSNLPFDFTELKPDNEFMSKLQCRRKTIRPMKHP